MRGWTDRELKRDWGAKEQENRDRERRTDRHRQERDRQTVTDRQREKTKERDWGEKEQENRERDTERDSVTDCMNLIM